MFDFSPKNFDFSWRSLCYFKFCAMNVAEYFRQPTENVGGFTTILSSFANLQIKHNYIQFSFEIPVSKR